MTHAFAMKEIALQAGVSLATVDRVLHQRPGVRAATQRRVHQAQLELERQQRQVGLKGRRFLIDLVMEAPLRFSRMVRDALDGAMRRVNAGQEPRFCDGEEADLVRSLHAAAARGIASRVADR